MNDSPIITSVCIFILIVIIATGNTSHKYKKNCTQQNEQYFFYFEHHNKKILYFKKENGVLYEIFKKIGFILLLNLLPINAQIICNDNNYSGNPGIPKSTCITSLSKFSLSIQEGGTFFIASSDTVTINNKKYSLRFHILPSSNLSYNQTQALAQTGYATKSFFSIIFVNYSSATNTLNDTNCAILNDANGKPTFVSCPIKSLSIVP